MKLQAIILAAGNGSRMADASGGKPKPLLEVGGKTLIEHQLDVLADSGIGPVTVVVGFKKDEVMAVVGNRADYVENPDPAGTNSLYSFWLARERIKGPVLICNCDLLYHPEIIDRLLDVKGSALVYDSSFGWGREKMKVGIVDGRVRAMSKDLPYGRATGENLGMICLSAEAAKVLVAKADEIVSGGNVQGWLAEALVRAADETPIHGVDIAGMPWIEIDYPQDLDNARKRVWPAIERDRWKRTVGWRRTRWLALALPLLFSIYVSLSIGRWMERPKTDWDSIPIAGRPAVTIKHGDGTQRWWLVRGEESARVEIEGPLPLRIEIRPVVSEELAGALFVTEVKVDGKSDDLSAYRPDTDAKVSWQDRPLGKRERLSLDVPAGKHVVEVSKAAGKHDEFLVRIREPERIEAETEVP